MVKELFLVRHAESESNVRGYFAGWLDSPLTQLGVAQARALSKRLVKERIGQVFCASSRRAKDTLSLIGIRAPVVYSPALREKNYGELEGVKWEEVPDSKVHHLNPFIKAPGGESVEDVQKRVVKFFEDKIFPCDQRKVLVVSHHGPLVTFACHVLGIPLKKWRILKLGNGGLCLFVREEGIWRLKLWNSLSGLGLIHDRPLLEEPMR